MSKQAVTFDFHNTLVHCDEWFGLEVRTLPGEFLRWHARSSGYPYVDGADERLGRAYRRLRSAIAAHGHELTAERSLAVVLGEAGIVIDEVTIARGVGDLMRDALRHAEAVQGAIETVSLIAREGVPVGVVSSAVYHPFLEWALDRFGMRRHIEIVVTSAASGYYKSRPEIYWEALGALGASPEESVHVGDSARYDVDGAARAGMRTVWLDLVSSAKPSVEPNLTLTSLVDSAPSILDLLRNGAR